MLMETGRYLGLAALIALAGACNGDDGPSLSQVKVEKAPTKSGDQQTGIVGTKLGNDLRVYASRDGQPVSGVSVAWFTSEGSVNPTTSLSDPDGFATTSWTLGSTVGAKAATATVTNASGSPLVFTAEAVDAVPPPGGTVVINVLGPDGGNRFEPSDVSVTVGSTVEWVWPDGSVQHNIVPDNGTIPETSGNLTDGPHTYSYTFLSTGVYHFHCANHGVAGGTGMSGTVTVVDQEL